jgi:hypothetical protein
MFLAASWHSLGWATHGRLINKRMPQRFEKQAKLQQPYRQAREEENLLTETTPDGVVTVSRKRLPGKH